MEKFAEKVVRSSANLAYEAYVNCLKTKQLLKAKLKQYLEEAKEVNIDNPRICKSIHELYGKVDEFVDSDWEKDVYKEVKQFLWPVNFWRNVDIVFTNLNTVCNAYRVYHNIMINNIKQGVEILEWMDDNHCMLSKRKCDDKLMLLLIHFLLQNAGGRYRSYVLGDVVFTKSKRFNEFKRIYEERDYKELLKFWKETYPQYILK